ncbi:MAG: hypothetical protein WC343_07585, partial [Bacilli bacterium]
MYRFQPGQRAQKAEDQGQEHAGRCLVASSFLWPAEITIVISKENKKYGPYFGAVGIWEKSFGNS